MGGGVSSVLEYEIGNGDLLGTVPGAAVGYYMGDGW